MVKNPSKILVATNHLDQIGGSEAYTYDLLKALKQIEGLQLEYFAFNRGLVSDKIESELQIPFMSNEKYDLIIANHRTSVFELYNKGKIIQVCHGIIPDLEQPSPLADYHIGISEEVSNHLTKLGYPNSVILNGVDVQQKISLSDPKNQIESVLSLCQSERANEILKKICNHKGWEFRSYNKLVNPTLDIEEHINKSDIVVGVGRSIYDAMACGRPCLIYDNRGYNGNKADGYLQPKNFWKYIRNNCSGRYLNRKYTEKDLIREFGKYNADHGKELRDIAVDNLNSNKMAVELLSMTKNFTIGNKLKKLLRYKDHGKLIKRVMLYKPLYELTGIPYFNKPSY
ncbi:glycosyltransferase family protein [Sphingobacterium endophyticum]|uniref:UDP-glycosyltransferase n=1 Tax=Sphingobacterium endophyticum TaxID=2546448 RepID=UPI0012E0CD12|nr:UDP-glycosyltransferase [Sphingobacterium endophyticum]